MNLKKIVDTSFKDTTPTEPLPTIKYNVMYEKQDPLRFLPVAMISFCNLTDYKKPLRNYPYCFNEDRGRGKS